MKKHFLLCILLLISLSAFSGCGAGGGSAPPGTPVAATLAQASVSDSSATVNYQAQNLQVLVGTTATPVSHAKVTLATSFTAAPDQAVLDANSLGIGDVVTLCDGTPLVNTAIELPETDEFGVTNACLRFATGGGLAYTVQFTVYSGNETSVASLAVTP